MNLTKENLAKCSIEELVMAMMRAETEIEVTLIGSEMERRAEQQ